MLPPCYHIILDNPWEEPEDVMDTLKVLLQIPNPFWLKLSSLVFYPGTELYERAKKVIRNKKDLPFLELEGKGQRKTTEHTLEGVTGSMVQLSTQ